jgi:hypothetical protein
MKDIAMFKPTYFVFAALLLASAGALAGTATVTYVNTERMTDVPRFQGDLESMQAQFLEHFNMLASQLPQGQELKIEIVDIDLAGDVYPRVAVQDVRVMRDRGDWPHIHLRFSIEQDGKVLSSGERRLVDMNYMHGFNRYDREIYSREKRLLDDWFRKETGLRH